MRKRSITLLSVLCISAALFAGGSSEKGSAAPVSEQAPLTGTLVSATPKEFTIFLNFNNMPFNSQWPTWQEAARRTNVSLKGIIPQTNSNEEEAFNLMLSSGDLADVIGYKDVAVIEQLGRDGGVIALNDLIDKYAPNIKAYMEKDPQFAAACYSLDGNIYMIPKNQELVSAEYWWIRKDWLDKLGLEIPQNVDEMYTVLSAFRNQDPNGNGIKDEVPLFDRAGWKMPDEYLYLWDTSTEFYPRNGKIVFEPLDENFPIGVKNIVKWYKEGLIDPEIFTRGPKGRDILLSGDLGGVTHDWVSAGNYNTTLTKSIPNFEMVAFAPPADQNGNRIERVMRYPGAGWSISSSCKDPVTLIKFFDYMFTDDGYTLMNWGIEGQTYYIGEDGNKHFTDVVMNSDQSPLGYLRSLGVQYRIGMRQDSRYEYAFMTEAGEQANLLYESNPQWFPENLPPYLDGALGLKYPPELEGEYQKIMANIRPYVDEKFQSWMLGTSDFEKDYPGFVKELKARGVDRAVEINQIAYDIFLGTAR